MTRARHAPRGAALDSALVALLVACAALVVGLANPSMEVGRTLHRQLLVFDITQSMNVVDDPRGADPPTRLDRARRAALGAMAKLPCGSQIGLGLFTGHRTLVLFAPVEVCAHYGDMAATIEAIDWRMAWEARSEVAKGLHSALLAARHLGAGTTVVFVTDGHEAPPINPELRPRYRGEVGEVRGAVAGIGGDELVPIPKLDSEGRRRGFWKPEDVLQVDTASLGRVGASDPRGPAHAPDRIALERRIAAGREHLSSLKESYLRALSAELRLEYARVRDSDDMRRLLEHPALGLRRGAALELRRPLGALALVLVVSVYASGVWRWRLASARGTP